MFVKILLKTILIITLLISLSACSLFDKKKNKVVVIDEQQVFLNAPDPLPISLENVTITIITPKNQKEVFEDLKKKGIDQVLFGFTDEGYVDTSENFEKIQIFIKKQKDLIESYRTFYEKK